MNREWWDQNYQPPQVPRNPSPALLTEMIKQGIRAKFLDERGLSESEVNDRIAARNESRVAKNWALSDRIRDELAAIGIVLNDNKDGTTTWEPKR